MPIQHRAEETHARILQAAESCFGKAGYEAASVDMICKEAGVTKRAFYHHFPSKQALFLTMLDLWLGQLDQAFVAARNSCKTVPEALALMAAQSEMIFADRPSRLPLLIEFWNQATRDPTIWQATIEPYRRYHQFFAQMLQEGITEGSLRPMDADLSARVLVAMAIGLILQGLMDPTGDDWGKVTRDGIAALLAGMVNPDFKP